MAINRNRISPTIRDMLDRSKPGNTVQRLGLDVTRKKVPADYLELATYIRNDSDKHVFVPDTCFFTAHEIPRKFWDAILSKRVAITTPVRHELEPWSSKPNYNKDMVQWVEAISADGPVVLADGEHWGSDRLLARHYYTTLLSSRKDRAVELAHDFVVTNGHTPSKTELRKLLQINFADRELMMVIKAVESGCNANWWTDEDLVTAALQIAVCSGCSTSILTRDRDVFDQFARLCSLINMDYQAFMFGERFKADPTGFQSLPCPRDSVTEMYFDVENSVLLRKPVRADQFTEWVLPQTYSAVQVSCVLFGGPANEMTMQVLKYDAEAEMDRLMATKGNTLGWNVDLSDDRNCRVTGLPETIDSSREFIFVGKDNWKPGHRTTMRWAELDCYHSIHEVGMYIRNDRNSVVVPINENDSVAELTRKFISALAPFAPPLSSGPHLPLRRLVAASADKIGDAIGARTLAKAFEDLADGLLNGKIPVDADEIDKAVSEVKRTAFEAVSPDFSDAWNTVYEDKILPYISLLFIEGALKTGQEFADVFRAVSYGFEPSGSNAG